MVPFLSPWRMRRVRYVRCWATSMAALLPPGHVDGGAAAAEGACGLSGNA
jgi:hypothetical protein